MSEPDAVPLPPEGKDLICPHLALQDDGRTCMSYPSHWNLCHRCRPAAVVRLSHQRDTCLTPAHVNCPVFQQGEGQPLPAHLREKPPRRRRPDNKVF